MEWTLLFIIISVQWKMAYGVRCYKCEPTIKEYTKQLLCQNFNTSELFVTECNSSTMCHKRETTHIIDNKVIRVTTRGCTPQTMLGYQEKIGRTWRHVSKIHEVDEACTDRNIIDTISFDCNCRGDLCNSTFISKSDVFCLLLCLLLAQCLLRR